MILGTAEQLIDYAALLQSFMPHPIRDERQYEATIEQINGLIDRGALTDAEQELLDLLGTLVAVYEDEHYADADFTLRGRELVRGLLEMHGLKQKDLLSIFKTKSVASEVLNGKRQMTVAHIDGLAAFFDLPHALFFEPAPATPLAAAG